MRTRDQAKYNAIVDASIRLVNEVGFDGISISKIATQAKVSPATIYIYFENKEDLFRKLYIDIRNQMGEGAIQNLRDDMTVEEGIDLAVRAITAAKNRDSASGGMIDVASITKEGFK